MYIMAKNNETSWVNREGDENYNDEELNREKIRMEIKKKIKELKSNKTTVDGNTSETIENMLAYLNELQTMENELYEVLKDENDSTDKMDIINKINNLSSRRDKLYYDMKQLSKDVKAENKASANNYQNQLKIVNIAEQELNREKERLKILNAEKYNKLRMVEINTYYSKKYEALGYITILVIFIFLFVILINYLTSSGYISEGVTNSATPILIGFGIFILFLAYFDVLRRSNFNFDEYAFQKEDGSGSNDGEIGIWPTPSLGTCIGERCCSEGTEYDTVTDTCKLPSEVKNDENKDDSNSEGFKSIVEPYRSNNTCQNI